MQSQDTGAARPERDPELLAALSESQSALNAGTTVYLGLIARRASDFKAAVENGHPDSALLAATGLTKSRMTQLRGTVFKTKTTTKARATSKAKGKTQDKD